jgi:ribosomal protein S8E
VGTSEHTGRASGLLRRERERVLLSEQEWPSAQRERVVSEGEDIDEQQQRASPMLEKKATLGGNQRRRVLRQETHLIGSPAKETHPTSMRLQYEIIGNSIAHYQYGNDQ